MLISDGERDALEKVERSETFGAVLSREECRFLSGLFRRMREHIQSPTTPINGHAPEDEAACVAFVHETATASPDSHFTFRPAALAHLDRLLQSRAEALARCQRYEREVMRLRPAPNEVHDLQPRERALLERLGRPGDDWDGVQLDRDDAATVCALVQRLQGAISNRMRPAAAQEPVAAPLAAPQTPSTAHLARLEALVVRAKSELAQRCPVLITLPEVEQFATDLGGLLAEHRIGERLDAQVAARHARLDAATTELARAARHLAAAHPDADGGRTKVEAVHAALHELADARAGAPPLPTLPAALEAALTGPGNLADLRRAIRRALADAARPGGAT